MLTRLLQVDSEARSRDGDGVRVPFAIRDRDPGPRSERPDPRSAIPDSAIRRHLTKYPNTAARLSSGEVTSSMRPKVSAAARLVTCV